MTKVKEAADKAPEKEEKQKETAVDFGKELIKVVLAAFLIATVFRTFFYEPFNIPSESMLPTLMTGDYIFVSKMSYGYSRHSLPFSVDLFEGRILQSDIERGDVAVFKLPRDGKTDYIKRVIGLPGDRIQMINGILIINDQIVKKERIEDFVFEASYYMDCYGRNNYLTRNEEGVVFCNYPQYRETLPNGVSYTVLDLEPYGGRDNTREFLVPEGHYFMMGDNRDNSQDSRVPSTIGVGFVPMENIVGRADFIFWSTDGNARLWQVWGWPGATRWDRILSGLNPEDG